MKYFKNLKTSERISLSFSLFGFLSLLLFLILINITYFFIWYADQKEMSFSSMNVSYKNYLESEGNIQDILWFKNYLLEKDTIIIPEMWELICSPWVAKKIHEAPEIIKDKFIYRDWETLYFIYSKYFQWVGEVKVFFDTTEYIKSQLIIIKTGLIFIFLVFILQFFLWRYISGRLLKDLKNISNKVKNVDINSHKKHIICKNIPENDEIRILADALNSSYDMIDVQTGKLKQFLTDVSHEFKTPLMGMSSELDVLEKKQEKWFLQDNDIQKFFLNARKNITKLNGLLETLFFLTRIEEQSDCLVKKEIHFKKYIEKKIWEISRSFPDKNISYDLDIWDDVVCSVEENTFSILLDNLLSNAIKFSPKDTQLKIYADDIEFWIQDNGPGIDVEDKEKIWEKFYRSDMNIEWFGVGLYLVKRIINIYGWTINLDSSRKTGARFIITL